MLNLVNTRNAYDQVNIAGGLNDKLASRDKWRESAKQANQKFGLPEAMVPALPTHPNVGRPLSAPWAATHMARQYTVTLACIAKTLNNNRLFWPVFMLGGGAFSAGRSPHASVFMKTMRTAERSPWHEMVFGRGCSLPLDKPDPASLYADMTYALSDYGLAGLLLEALPTKLAQQAHLRSYNRLATACMAAAVVGRSYLQPGRCAAAAGAVTFAVVMGCAIGLACTALVTGLQYLSQHIDSVERFAGTSLPRARHIILSAQNGISAFVLDDC